MTDLEKIMYGEEIDYELDYQAFEARSTTSSKKGVVFEFSIETVTNELYTVKAFVHDEDGKVDYLGADINTSGNPVKIDTFIEHDEDDFEEKVTEWIVEVIENIQ